MHEYKLLFVLCILSKMLYSSFMNLLMSCPNCEKVLVLRGFERGKGFRYACPNCAYEEWREDLFKKRGYE